MLRYSRPKSQHWGHGCDRLSAVELLQKVDQFLVENTIVEERHKRQALQLVWRSPPDDPMADAITAIKSLLSLPTETFEQPEPSPHTMVVAKLTGQRLNIPHGSKLKRLVWTLTDEQLALVARWLDQNDAAISQHSVGAFANRHLTYQWNAQHRGRHEEFAEGVIFGVVLSHPRHIQVPFYLYDAEHYFRVKRYMAEIGLASLLDKCVSPKGSLNGGITGGAG